MNWFQNLNIVTVIIAGIFLLPIFAGMFTPFSSSRVLGSFISLFSNLELLIAFFLSCYFTRLILADDSIVLTKIFKLLPAARNFISSQSIWAYIITVLILLLMIYGVLRLLTIPVYRFVVVPLSNGISSAVNSMSGAGRGIVGGLWKLPKSILFVLLFTLLLNLYSNYGNNSYLSHYINQSSAYQKINEKVLDPLMASGLKRIPIILNDSFKKAVKDLPSESRKILVRKYFNGMTLAEAVKSDSEINDTARKIVGSEKNDKEKAYLLYQWICENVRYDNYKAKIIAEAPTKVSSGAIVAYHTREGICFDDSCLYVAMCRAVGLKVRFVTGLGYSGDTWGDHAWNQVYYPKENRWINVDTTFGGSGRNYFDRSNFSLDHRDAVVQEEW